MSTDYLGNPVSTGDAATLAAIDDFVAGFLGNEARAANILEVASNSDAAAPNAYAGALYMLMESPRGPPRARAFLAKAEKAGGNARERAATAFLRAWTLGDTPAAMALSAGIVAEWPRDLAMAKLNQYLAFNVGDHAMMLRVAGAAAAASADVPQAHGMIAFALEEADRLAEAEAAARTALAMTEREPWAQHALAHVMLAQGRIDEGAAFMAAASATWTGLSSFMMTHNWWHLALFHLSQGRGEAVLGLYDERCWAGDRDYSQDQVGAVSLLARLEFAGVDVGDRWADLAEHLAARGPDTELPFLSLQYLYGLARAGRPEAVGLLDAIRRRAGDAPPAVRRAWAEVAAPAAEGIAAYLAGDHDAAIRNLGPALPRLIECGGSHAQRDLFEQIHLAALLAGERWAAAKTALERRRAFDPDGVPLNRTLARVCDALGEPREAAEARARADRALSRRAA
jgi:tetratricopeptide (TPR) repeat protein